MAFDLMVGKSALQKDNPIYLLGFEFDTQVKVIGAMQKRYNSAGLILFCNPFDDFKIQGNRLEEVKIECLEILVKPDLKLQEKNILCQIIASVVFALERGESLLGLTD